MEHPHTLLSLTLSLATACLSSAPAQEVYSEAFDSAAGTRVLARQTEDTRIRYVDYSDFKVGEASFSLPEAPGKLDGSLPTRGVLLQANLESGTPNALNLVAAETPGGAPISISGTYRLSFDCYINLADPIPGGGTEQLLWGIGAGNNALHSRANRTDAALEGIWGWLAGENGYRAEDSVVFAGMTERERKGDGDSQELFNAAFTSPGPFANMAARTWTRVVIEVFSDVTRVLYNGVLFHELPVAAGDTEGAAFIGYEDAFASLSEGPDFQWGLFDNLLVESITEPALAVRAIAPFATVNVPGGSSTATFRLTNKRDAPLQLTEAALSGDHASAFRVLTALPVTLAAGGTTDLEVQFVPGELSGVLTAALDLQTDDAVMPSTRLDLEGARFAELLAHFKFDDTGNPPEDASGNRTRGVYQDFRFVPEYGQPSLFGGAGQSVRFTDDHPSGSGNWVQYSVPHTPSVTISVWIKPDEGVGGNVIFNRTNTPSFVDNDGLYGMALEPDGTLIVRIRDEPIVASEAGAIQPGTAYQVAFTHRDDDGFENDTAVRSRLYIDGQLVDEAVGSATLGFGDYPGDAASTDLHLGTRIAAGSGYAGSFDDLQIYRLELEPRQIAQLFAEPESPARFDNPNLHVLFNGDFGRVEAGEPRMRTITIANGGQSETLAISASALTGADAAHFDIGEVPESLAPGESFPLTVTFDPGNRLGGFSATLELTSNDETDATLSVPLRARVPNPSGLLAHYRLDESEGPLLADSSGNRRPAVIRTEGGGSVTYGLPALAAGSAIRLAGGDEDVVSLIEIPASAELPALPTYTVSLWFELEPADEDTGSVLFSQGDSLARSSALALLVSPSDGPLQWIVNQDQGESTANDLIRSGRVYHLVVTHVDTDPAGDGADSLRFYRDGVLVETLDSLAAAIVSEANTPFLFGGVPGASGMIGRLDDLQLYGKALSPEEVRFLFENPGTAIGAQDPATDSDTDGDGLTDRVEADLGTDPERADSDGDGFSDGQEVAAKTDPLNRLSRIAIDGVALDGDGGGVSIRWLSQPGVPYVVEFSEDLRSFTVLAAEVLGEAGKTTSIRHPGAPAQSAYYRVGVKPE